MRNIPIGEWGAYIVLMYDMNSSCETKKGDSLKRYTITVHNICSQWDGMFTVHDTTNQQLVDIERFCTWDPSSVDPTFNLGAFYHNILDETTRGNNPLLLGPILIHQTHIQALPLSCIHVDSTEPTVDRIEGIRNMFPQSCSAEVHKPFMTKCQGQAASTEHSTECR